MKKKDVQLLSLHDNFFLLQLIGLIKLTVYFSLKGNPKS